MSQQSLDQALRLLEASDPRVKAARERLDETMDSITTRIALQPVIDEAKRMAILELLHEKFAACDQKGLDSTIIAAQFRGYDIQPEDLTEQLFRCPPQVIEWWSGRCDLHEPQH